MCFIKNQNSGIFMKQQKHTSFKSTMKPLYHFQQAVSLLKKRFFKIKIQNATSALGICIRYIDIAK